MKYTQLYATDHRNGNALPLALATVYVAGTTTKAALFNASGAAATNPLTATNEGVVAFAVRDGVYDIQIRSADASYTAPLLRNFQIVDELALAKRTAFTFDTQVAAAAAVVEPTATVLSTQGYASIGDNGGGTYQKVASQPAHSGKFLSADGAWWELREVTPRPEQFGANANAASDTAGTQAAIDYAVAKHLNVVKFQSRKYYLNAITWSDGITLSGTSAGYNSGGYYGTILERASDCVMLSVTGASTAILASVQAENLTISGASANYASICVDIKAASLLTWRRVFMTNCKQALRLLQVYDSRFYDCRWDSSGDKTGAVFVLELSSNLNGYLVTNQIHFYSCVMENLFGPGFGTTGTNTNEIYFNDFKFETANMAFPMVTLDHVLGVLFNGLQIASGTSTSLEAFVKLSSCNEVMGTIQIASLGSSAGIQSYLKWRVCGFLDLMIDAANATVVPATGKLIDYDYLYRANVKVRSSNSGSRPPVELSDVDSSGLAIIQSQSHSPTLQLTRGDVGTGGINWYLGRVDNTGNAYLMRNETVLEKYGVDGASLPTLSWPYGQLYVQAPTGVTPQMRWSLADRVGENFYMRMNADVTGVKFDLIHNATTVFSLRNDNSLRLAGAFVMPSFTVTTAPNPSTASGVGAGAMIYVTNGNAGSPCLAVSDGASWKRIALGAAIAAS